MSTPPFLEPSETSLLLTVRDLSRTVDLLSARVAYLESLLPVASSGWVLLTEESIPLSSGICSSRFAQTEEGPPEIPNHIFGLTVNLHAPPGAWIRGYRAWEGGFWCGIALRTYTNFYPLNSIDVPDKLWVVFRAPGITRPFAVESHAEVDRLLALPGHCRLAPIVVGFPSHVELHVFCAGGGLCIPAFYQWRSR